MACIGWNLHVEFLHPQTFLRLYATIRSWNAPISAVVYGFYAFQILHLTGSWKIPLVIVSLVVTQIAGSSIWTIGTMTAKSPVDLRVESSMVTAGTLLCTMGATLCSACVLVSMIFFIRNNPVWRSRVQKELLVDFQLISTRIHAPLMLVTTTDLIGYLFFPTFHVSIVMAIIVGKIWSNTLMHGLNSRRGLRAIFYAPQTSTDLETIEFAQRRQRRNSPVGDHEVSMEFADYGRIWRWICYLYRRT
ncbi:hypothetical protein BS47DRAFT_1379267 [Hydnum rufescens UP504]|uniref:Uncharacterized protein n=1 Tax=Hydnum rufescens UP504 TaxID=1448309 RepID=A0A9P6DZF7_9AGAM|nr:hypothetical protein BS47DRAFT_1379267 [Hydnum rufescens UP504]